MHYYNIYVFIFFIIIAAAAAVIKQPAIAAKMASSGRPSRHLYYTAITLAGFAIAHRQVPLQSGPFTAHLSASILLINMLFAGSMALNNLHDRAIDAVNEKNNSYSTVSVSKVCLPVIIALFGLSVCLAALVSYAVAAVTACVILVGFAYSSPPARLKRFFPVNIIVIAASTVLALALGYTCGSGSRGLEGFPWLFAASILAGTAMSFNTKDVNDYKGDKKYGIQTLMTLLGPANGRAATALLAFCGYMTVSAFSGSEIVTAAGIILGLATSALVYMSKKRLNEPVIFTLFFLFTAVFAYVNPYSF
ncbi:MAG TPA: UbiA family prenyltransferase [Candidatus Goldiibacteriota bacterium]|nr:UbiA family prenyltransferase [Candidatus Goldiibacteriota bacterium]